MAKQEPNQAQKLTSTDGTLVCTGTTDYTGLNKCVIEFTSDTTFTACSGTDPDGAAVNFITDSRFFWQDMLAGERVFVKDGFVITRIKLSTGRVLAH